MNVIIFITDGSLTPKNENSKQDFGKQYFGWPYQPSSGLQKAGMASRY